MYTDNNVDTTTSIHKLMTHTRVTGGPARSPNKEKRKQEKERERKRENENELPPLNKWKTRDGTAVAYVLNKRCKTIACKRNKMVAASLLPSTERHMCTHRTKPVGIHPKLRQKIVEKRNIYIYSHTRYFGAKFCLQTSAGLNTKFLHSDLGKGCSSKLLRKKKNYTGSVMETRHHRMGMRSLDDCSFANNFSYLCIFLFSVCRTRREKNEFSSRANYSYRRRVRLATCEKHG